MQIERKGGSNKHKASPLRNSIANTSKSMWPCYIALYMPSSSIGLYHSIIVLYTMYNYARNVHTIIVNSILKMT